MMFLVAIATRKIPQEESLDELQATDDKKVACSSRRAPRKTERSGGKSQHKSLTMVELMFLRHGVRHENVTHVGAVRHFYYQPPGKKSITSTHSWLAGGRAAHQRVVLVGATVVAGDRTNCLIGLMPGPN
ncbi:uncharacterized protein NPIL_300611 [Nephila pilipes]|uniref:Uncharacterized protein n=1 Tax=Nephila pilipes TaxID=299642 RepID=A0A8X6QKB4_NEPPI|nr:uncharacterized protein NPIL_300611 [Nephila pilipes]